MTVGIATMERFDNRMPNTVGSSRIRVRWLLPYWEEAEEYIIGKQYDVLIYQKVYWKDMMKAYKGIQILDLCDPDWLEKKPVFEFIDLVDAVVTSSEPLAQYIRKLRPGKKVVCIPDRIYLPEHTNIKSSHSEQIKDVVWFGYYNNVHYLEKTFDQLMLKGIRLNIISDQPYTAPLTYRNLEINNIPYNYESLHSELIKYDALLLPPPTDDVRGAFKSNNKVLTGMALGIPVIEVPEDFDRLATQETRIKEARMKRQEVETLWDVKLSVAQYKKLIAEIGADYDSKESTHS